MAYTDVGQGREQGEEALRLLLRATAINCEARLALNADRPTEPGIIMLKEYSGLAKGFGPFSLREKVRMRG